MQERLAKLKQLMVLRGKIEERTIKAEQKEGISKRTIDEMNEEKMLIKELDDERNKHNKELMMKEIMREWEIIERYQNGWVWDNDRGWIAPWGYDEYE